MYGIGFFLNLGNSFGNFRGIIFGLFFGIFLEFFLEILWNFFGILWEFSNSVDNKKLFEYGRNLFVYQDFSIVKILG